MSFQQLIAQKDLDISIVELKDLEWSSRFDAEFYKPIYLQGSNLIINKKHDNLLNITKKIDVGFVWTMVKEYTDEGVTLLQTQNVQEFFLDVDNVVKINNEFHNKLKKSQINYWDILIARSWSFGKASIYLWKDTINSSDVIIIEAKEEAINPFYLLTFINSRYWVGQLIRFASWWLQGHVNLWILESFSVPFSDLYFQETIAKIIKESFAHREKSKSLYQQAEQLLLSELGLENYKPTENNISVKNSNEVGIFSRMDAEFFQPKYDEIIEKIKNYKWWRDVLDNLIEVSDEKIQQTENKIFQYVELADIDGSNWLVNEFTKIEWQDLPSRAQMKIKKGDVVLSSVAWSCSKIALITSNDDNLVASTGFFILRSKFFNPETNLLLMKSWMYQEFLKRTARGMILEATNKDDFKKYILPKVDNLIQQKIAELVTQSHKARNESKKLLDVAKRAVEIFIEEDEEKAMEFISKSL